MKAARASRHRLARVAAAARAAGVPATPGQRLAARLGGGTAERPGLAELATWPAWPGANAEAQARIWRIAALVAARDAVDTVIDGEMLRAYAGAVGEAALEAILTLPAGGDAALAEPTRIEAIGRDIARRALPATLARAVDAPAVADRSAIADIAAAERIAFGTAA